MQKVTEMKLPYFPFYGGDFLLKTGHLTKPEIGVYLILLIHQWSKGYLNSDPNRLPIECVDEWAMIEPFFPLCDDGNRRNPRLELERSKITEAREKQRLAGIKGADRRWGNHSNPNGVAIDNPTKYPNSETIASSDSESDSESDKEPEKNKDSINEALLPFLSIAAKFHDTQAKNWPKQTVFKTSLRAKTDLTGADALEKLHRLDGWSMDEISDLLEWIPDDEFWRVNIRSLGNIRKKSNRNDAKKIENAQASMQRSPKEKSTAEYLKEARDKQGSE